MTSGNPTSPLLEQRDHGLARVPGQPSKKDMEALLEVVLKQYFDWIGGNLLISSAPASEREKISHARERIQFLAAATDNAFCGFTLLQGGLDAQSIFSETDSLWNDEDFEIARNACAVQTDELNAIAAAAREALEGFPPSRQSSPATSETSRTLQQAEEDLVSLGWLDAYLVQAAAAGTVLRTSNTREACRRRELTRYFLEPLEPLHRS